MTREHRTVVLRYGAETGRTGTVEERSAAPTRRPVRDQTVEHAARLLLARRLGALNPQVVQRLVIAFEPGEASRRNRRLLR